MLEVSGLAVPFGVACRDRRQIAFGLFPFRAFESRDVPILVNHNRDRAKAINAGAATFHQDGLGLHFIARVADSWAAGIEAAYLDGQINGCSITWLTHRSTTCPLTGRQIILDAELDEVSLMIGQPPAFRSTYVDVRRV